MTRKVLLDTNVYIGWLNGGLHADLLLGPGLARYLSAVVAMELGVGARLLPARRALDQLVRAYQVGGRVVVPDAQVFDRAGRVLQRILVNDVLIALSARSIGATVVSADADFEVIETVVDFKLELIR